MSAFGRGRNSVYRFRERFLPSLMSAKVLAHPFTFAMLSHAGRVRKGNEDTCAASPADGAFIVCDGMGGAAAGEVASRLAADTFLAHLAPSAQVAPPSPRRATPDLRLDAAIHAANQAVYQHSRQSPDLRGMGTTLVALLLEPHAPPHLPTLTLAHVGDSRCYLFRDGTLTLLTHDHSLVEEQLRAGQITAFEALHHPMRNIITRAVGSAPTVEPEIRHLDPHPGDLYLLASDGLTRELPDPSLAAILQRAHRNPDRTLDLDSLCRTFIDEGNDAGGGDNITVLLLQLP
jgi:serine/threonine protein phosphatase PrpC